MVCSRRYYFLDLPVELVYCQVEGFPSCLRHICQVEYDLFNYINFYVGERNIFSNFVDELGGGRKSDKSKKVGYRTVISKT